MRTSKQLTKKLVNAIVANKCPYNEDFGRKYINEYTRQNKDTTFIPAIVDCIRDRQLTNAIELLEKRGISGDLALFIVGNLQDLGVAR